MKTEPVAIVGIGCRFPGAEGPEAFWRLLRDGVDATTEIPADRFDVDAVYDPRPGIPGKISARRGGFLEQVDQFDPYFFGISAREAAAMDPQQRLLLEVAWEAIEDAGLVPERLDADRTGVFVGNCNSDYRELIEDPADLDIYVGGGIALSVLSGRISYVLGLQGPSTTIDTACSTSLVAVHLACQSLWSGETTLALAGGVNLILAPEPYMSFSQAGMLAADGRCKFGDASADGFARSEGAGVVALKPLSLALADGDPVYAVIRGGAVNNDGNSGGLLMQPSRAGQEAAFRKAYRSAGLSPGDVQYVEVHGTGTSVGDPIEAQALGAVLAEGRPEDRPCIIGSVKTNIGHTEGAAGVAGLIKAALSLKHREIPPSLHFENPNPDIPWQDLPLVVQRELGPWPEGSGPARAGVSSFGISGTNAHIVLEEAPGISPTRNGVRNGAQEADTDHLLPLSAYNPESLEAVARIYREFLIADDGEVPSLRDVCYTAGVRRTHHDHRLAVVGNSREELAENLEAFLQGEPRQGVSSGRNIPGRQRKLVFVFPGQGSQWVGMGRELMKREPAFREALERCERAMREYVDWSLIEELAADEECSRLDEVGVIQPAIFAVQVALAALWRSWGVEPDAVVGQSMGEVAAAHVAGALSLDDAARVICRRSQLVKETSGQGGMAVVQLSLEEAQSALAGYEERVSVGVSTSPSSTVLSGEPAALEEILKELEGRDVFYRWVKVDYAAHSPQLDPLRPRLLEALEGVNPQPTSVPLYSTVTGEITDGRAFDADYWVENLRQPVLFWPTLRRLSEEGYDVFLEMSPHPTLLHAIEEGLSHLGREGTTLPSLRQREERSVMLGSFGALHALGHPVDWNKLYPSGGRVVRLPSYPWQRERFWLDVQKNGDGGQAGARRSRKGHLLGEHLGSAADSGTHYWEMDLGVNLYRYLGDHRVQGLAVLPAAAYAEMALAAAAEVFGPGSHVLEEVAFKKALFFPEDGAQTAQLVFSTQMIGETSFQFFSRPAGAEEQEEAPWTLHAIGKIRLGQVGSGASEHESPEELQARCTETISREDLYKAMEERGLQYGPTFQGVEQIWRREGEAVGRLRLPEAVASEASAYQVHPALLDACFQVLAATLAGENTNTAEEDVYLPVGLGKMRLYDRPGTDELWSHALLRSDAPADADKLEDTLEGDVFLLDESGRVVLEALGLRLQRVERDARGDAQQDLDDWLYETQWQPQPRPREDQALGLLPPEQQGSWLVFTDGDGVGQKLQELLQARGETCFMVSPGEAYRKLEPGRYQIDPASTEDIQMLLADTSGSDRASYRGVIHLWSLETAPPEETTLDSLEEARALGTTNVLHLVQAFAEAGPGNAPRLWLVARGSQPVGDEIESVSVAQSPLWGMGRVISVEHPELRCTKVDLSPSDEPGEIESLFQELWAEDKEDQIALRGETRYVARLVRSLQEEPEEEEKRPASPEYEPFSLDIPTPGILDSMVLRESTRREPGPGEIEIHVRAVGLNFRDVLIAMDLVPPVFEGSLDVGFECAGEITAVGEGVEGLRVGDEVLAGAPACFGSFVTTDTSLVVPKPAHLSFEEAATIPIAFLTAYYALHRLARIREGERVLIHAAAGGVGLAAVQLAQQAGAEIFATAGTPEKREFLRSLGIEYVMNSRTLEFADEVMEYTDGEGVDVVLNSLAGDFIPKSLSTLRAGGRFLEIGKVDVLRNTQLGLKLLENNISFSIIELAQMLLKQPDFCMSILREAMQHFENGSFKPLPLQVFPISQAVDAFRYMAQAKHIGKVVISLQEDEVPVAPSKDPMVVRPDGTYLITGGCGGIGLSTAQWLVQQGARHLVLTGRSGASAAAKEAIETMEAAGARVVVAKADVSQEPQVAGVLAEIRRSMPPLRGIFHAAGVLDDGVLLQLNEERFASVMAPKVNGAWSLHRLTLDEELDCFVLFSSAASVFGSPGQGNYVAANAFLDALAHHRRAVGLPALAINWGAWAEVGLATRADRVKHVTGQGIIPFTPAQGVQLMGEILRRDMVQAMGISIDWDKLLGAYSPPLLSQLAEEMTRESAGPKEKSLARERLLAAEPEDRQQLVEGFLVEQMARVLKCSPSKVDVYQPLNRLGIDSLMAVELKNRVEADLELAVPVTALLQGPSLAQLTTHLLEQLAPAPDVVQSASASEKDVDQLSDEEVDLMLRDLVEEEEDKVTQ